MRLSCKTVTKSLIGLLLIPAFIIGCGGASSNDQGVSFTFLGWFSEVPSSGSSTTGLLGKIVPINGGTTDETGDLTGGTGAVFAVAGVQNNLDGQFIRTDRMLFSFEIEGAEAQPPSTVQPFSGIVGPGSNSGSSSSSSSSADAASSARSSLPPNFTNANTLYGNVPVVPLEVMQWINFNRSSLPELPFTMVVTASISGITSGGDRLDTNPMQFIVEFTPDVIIDGGESSSSSSADSGDEVL